MDTSIIVVIAIIVVFVVAVPTMIRKSATELSRVEIDTVPDQAQIVAADPQNPCHDHTERAKVFHKTGAIEPTVPRLDVTPMTNAPVLRLSAPAPAFSIIDGHADTATTTAEASDEVQCNVLPVAVGETGSAYLGDFNEDAHAAAAAGEYGVGNVRMLHPAVHAVFNQSQQNASGVSGTGVSGSGISRGGNGRLGDKLGAVPLRPDGQVRGSAPQGSVGSDTSNTNRRGTQNSNPNFGADEEHSMTEKATTLRESMSSLTTMVRGFALLFLASALGILVTGVLAMFSVVHVALVGVFFGLAVVSLFIVRSLNLRKWEIKARLRDLERTPTNQTGPTLKSRQGAPSTSTVPRRTVPQSASPAHVKSTRAAQKSAGSAKEAQAHAVMQRSTIARQTKEEADTGEVPMVRIRNESAEGHSTRQVLLTGPIPVVEEKADAAAPETSEANSTQAEAIAELQTETTESTKTAQPSEDSTGEDSTSVVSTNEDDSKLADHSEEQTDSGAVSANVSDPFMQRLKARDAWSPTPLPVPSYVQAPEVEHTVPEAKAADAASYETEARSREDIAAEFAAELGYRPELSDSAREDEGPLEHGRKAIRTTKAPELNALDDVLARRRA